MSNRQFPAVPDPGVTTQGNHAALVALKQGYEVLTDQRGDGTAAAVTWQDLVNLGLITPLQVPKK